MAGSLSEPDSVGLSLFYGWLQRLRSLLFFLLVLPLLMPTDGALASPETRGRAFDSNRALKISRMAIGRSVENYTFKNRQGNEVTLSSFHGKPLVVSLVYTSCYHICSVATRFLAEMVQKARDALGEESFQVLTIGFDSHFDIPKNMAYYARQQGLADDPNWHFFSGDAETIGRLVRNLGFTYIRSPKGFDHVVQATVIDAKGVIYRQVYGETFEAPLLVEPLKELILGLPAPQETPLEELVRRVRFFCTTYDPKDDAYKFDYSLFVGMFIGGSIILLGTFSLIREMWKQRKNGSPT